MAVAFVRRWNTGRTTSAGSFALGLAIGLALHVTPSLMPVALGFLLFECAWLRASKRGRRAALLLAGMALACVPWTWRNATTLGGFMPMRSNFGLELRMGNHEGAGPTLESSARSGTERHPRSSEAEARQVRELGEMEYMRRARHEAVTWIRSHPGEFLRLTCLRVAQFWFGPVDDLPAALGISVLTLLSIAGAWRAFPALSVAQRAAIVIPLAAYPLVYYVVGFEARYRQPVDGLALVLAASALIGRRRPVIGVA
jgi:hypothetical protein